MRILEALQFSSHLIPTTGWGIITSDFQRRKIRHREVKQQAPEPQSKGAAEAITHTQYAGQFQGEVRAITSPMELLLCVGQLMPVKCFKSCLKLLKPPLQSEVFSSGHSLPGVPIAADIRKCISIWSASFAAQPAANGQGSRRVASQDSLLLRVCTGLPVCWHPPFSSFLCPQSWCSNVPPCVTGTPYQCVSTYASTLPGEQMTSEKGILSMRFKIADADYTQTGPVFIWEPHLLFCISVSSSLLTQFMD